MICSAARRDVLDELAAGAGGADAAADPGADDLLARHGRCSGIFGRLWTYWSRMTRGGGRCGAGRARGEGVRQRAARGRSASTTAATSTRTRSRRSTSSGRSFQPVVSGMMRLGLAAGAGCVGGYMVITRPVERELPGHADRVHAVPVAVLRADHGAGELQPHGHPCGHQRPACLRGARHAAGDLLQHEGR